MRLDDEAVIERAKHPRRKGFEARVVWDASAQGDNPFCGDAIEVCLTFAHAGGRTVVSHAAFEGYACTLCTACADVLMEYVEGRPLDEVASLKYETVLSLWDGGLVVGRTRRGCVEVSLTVLQRALAGHVLQ